MSFTKKIYQIIIALFFYTLFTVAVFWNPIINKFGAMQWDAISVHFFNLLFSSQAWHSGTFPLWTPYIFNGFPQIADLQVAIFYPVNFAVSFFAVFTAQIMQSQLILHYFLAGFFGFLFAKHLSKNFFFSLAAGIAYAFSGFMVGHGSHVGMQNTSAWLPLLFLFLILALEKKQLVYGLFCGLFLGIAILAGHFQMALYSAYGLGLYFTFDFLWSFATFIKRKLKEQKEHGQTTGEFSSNPARPGQFIIASQPKKQTEGLAKKILIIFAIYIIAFLISAIQLLPTYELTAKSQRATITLEMSQTESLNPDSLWGLLKPNYNNVSHGGNYTGPWDRTQNYLFISISILILAILGAICGLASKNSRKITTFWILLLTTSLIYSLGEYGFLQKYYFQFLPFFDKIRAPSNMMLLFDLAIIGLAAMFFKFIDDLQQSVARFSNVLQNLENSSRLASEKFDAVPVTASWRFRPLFSLAKLVNFPRTFAMFSKRAMLLWIFSILILLIISLKLFYAVSPNELLYSRKSPDETTKKPWIAENIQSEYAGLDEINKFRVFRIPEFQNNSTQMWQIYAFDGYNPLALARHGNYIDAMVKNAKLVDLAGIKYLPCQFIAERAERLEKVGNLCINENYYPRAFFVDNFIIAENDQDALAKLSSIGDTQEVVILEENPKAFLSQNSNPPSLIAMEGRGNQSITITDTKPGFWKLTTQNDSDSFLVFSQTNYPGWQVKIDGQDTKIYQADYLFQAIFAPKGNHEIIFEYKSPLLKKGAILTIIGLAIVVLGVISLMIANRISKNA